MKYLIFEYFWLRCGKYESKEQIREKMVYISKRSIFCIDDSCELLKFLLGEPAYDSSSFPCNKVVFNLSEI